MFVLLTVSQSDCSLDFILIFFLILLILLSCQNLKELSKPFDPNLRDEKKEEQSQESTNLEVQNSLLQRLVFTEVNKMSCSNVCSGGSGIPMCRRVHLNIL